MSSTVSDPLPRADDGNGFEQKGDVGLINGLEPAEGIEEERSITILYMTATGTSEDVALRVARQARRKRFRVRVYSVESYDVADLMDENLVLFVVSTAGQGEFPPVATQFWHLLLRKSLPADVLAGVTFAAFGLGDSSYPRFCWPVRLLDRRLRALGANQLLEHGEADESHYLGLEASLQPWLDNLWSHLAHILPLQPGTTEIGPDELLPPTTQIRTLDSVSTSTSDVPSSSATSFADHLLSHGWTPSSLLTNQRMTEQKHFQDVRLLEFSRRPLRTILNGARTEDGETNDYEPGDVLCLHPQNDATSVTEILGRLGYSGATQVTVSGEMVPSTVPHAPHHITLTDLFTYHLDFTSVPRQSFFDQIRLFAGQPGSLEREKLDEYCGIYPAEALAKGDVNPQEGIDEMFEYAQRPRRTIKEVLDEFKSVQIPIEYIAEVIPWIKPREFSIASSPANDVPSCPQVDVGGKGKFQLAVAMVKYKTRLRKPRTGLCTRWLSTLAVGTEIPIRLKKGYLTLPPLQAPLILIGPGTGCAPLRSLVLDRLAATAATPASKIHLFVGFRNRDKDYLFGSDWNDLARQYPDSIHLHTAFSRQDSAAKVYVQDLILEEGSVLWRSILEQNAHIIVAGSSGKMPEQVRASFEKIAVQQASMDADQAKRFLDMLERQKRWQEECWS